jgi:hypothetical protein
MIDIGTKELANHFNFGSFSANFERLISLKETLKIVSWEAGTGTQRTLK